MSYLYLLSPSDSKNDIRSDQPVKLANFEMLLGKGNRIIFFWNFHYTTIYKKTFYGFFYEGMPVDFLEKFQRNKVLYKNGTYGII